MLLISKPETDEQTVKLRLEGQIAGAWVDEMRLTAEKLLGNSCRLVLDLAEVTYVDADGVALLADFKSRGVVLVNRSPFVDEQLRWAAKS
jgi:anti-anti-sigma regulatory factor